MTKTTYWLIAALIAIAFAAFLFTHPTRSPSEVAAQALEAYKAGELKNSAQDFNQALTLYLSLDKNTPNSALYYNIGNTYFQLNQIPRAILYYYRGLALSPNDSAIKQNLAIARKKLELPPDAMRWRVPSSLFLQSFALFSICFFILMSLYLWISKKWLKTLGYVALFFMLFSLGAVLHDTYFTPIEAILLRASALHLDAGEQYAPVLPQPLPAGTKVEVISNTPDHKWIKVRTVRGDIGYVSEETLRVI